MRTSLRLLLLSVVIPAGSLFLAACGSNPAGPTAGGAILQGTVETNAAVSGAAFTGIRALSAQGGGGITVSVSETGQSTTTDGNGDFVLTGLPSGTITLKFKAPGIDASLEISGLEDGQTVTIKVHVSGSHADLTQPPKHEQTTDKCFKAGEKAEVEGNISAKAAGAIKVAQQGKGAFECEVSASTRIRKGNKTFTFDDLAVGMHVHVSGTGLGPSGSVCRVSADEIKIQ